MGEWKREKLGDISLVTKLAGYEFTKYMKYVPDGEIIAVRALNLRDGTLDLSDVKRIERSVSLSLPRSQLHVGDIVLSYTGTIGACAYINANDTYHLAPNVAKIEPRQTVVCPQFIFNYIRGDEFQQQLRDCQHGSTQPTIPMAEIRELQIPVPDLPTQRRIAAVLGALDDKIEVNRKICENLEAQAQALFKAWFVDFEPFGGKRPEGWKMGKLGDVAEVTSGKRPPTRSDVTDGENVFPLLGAAAVMGFTSQYMFDEPILVTGRVGTHGVIQRSFGRSWPSDNTLVIRAKRFEFVYQILKRIDYGKMNRGSTQPLITQSDLKSVEIQIPDEALQNQFEETVAPLMRLQYVKSQESRALAAMRDALLPKLMSGELAVEKVTLF